MLKEHLKIYSGTSIFVDRLSYLLSEANIPTIINNVVETGRLAGFGTLSEAVELFIFKRDLEKATPIIENFKKEISE